MFASVLNILIIFGLFFFDFGIKQWQAVWQSPIAQCSRGMTEPSASVWSQRSPREGATSSPQAIGWVSDNIAFLCKVKNKS